MNETLDQIKTRQAAAGYTRWLEVTYVGLDMHGMWAVYSDRHFGRLSPLRKTKDEAEQDRLTMVGSHPL